MSEFLESVKAAWTPGATGIWVLVIMGLVGMWKGLPAVLDAWTNSVDREREHREREIKRLEDQLHESDKRHAECMNGQDAIRREMAEMHREHSDEVARLQKVITGLIIQMRQMQLSAVSGAVMPPMPAEFSALLETIDGKANQ